ncbi:MAG: EAL domain-containing response regulator [Thalassobaculaceae bacterium]|nr:EAL domain-containing response regulator [Thalassobaculaceae bacterium]
MTADRLLLIDDEAAIGRIVGTIAVDLGFSFQHITDPNVFDAVNREFRPTALMVDLAMPGFDGVAMLNLVHDLAPDTDILLISGFDRRVLNSAREFGLSKGLKVKGVLPKPIEIDALEAALIGLRERASGAAPLAPGDQFDERELRRALSDREVFPRFQPKVTLDVGGHQRSRLVGAEALARWQHPTRGEVQPYGFIPQMEAMGLIGEMTDVLFGQVLYRAGLWATGGYHPEISVNLSPLMLRDLSLPDRYEAQVRAAGLSTRQFTFEVTESAAMLDVVATSEILTRFRLKGFGLSLDDFGTGHSSLVELYRMPFNELKIDRLFVGRALKDQEADVIVRLLVDLARGLGLTVCAEGAEDEETLAYLARIGCQRAQGYVIDRPLLADEFSALLAAALNA